MLASLVIKFKISKIKSGEAREDLLTPSCSKFQSLVPVFDLANANIKSPNSGSRTPRNSTENKRPRLAQIAKKSQFARRVFGILSRPPADRFRETMLVYKTVENRIRKALKHHIHERYKVDVPVVLERPPKLAMGEAASPLCFELAKQMRKPPRALAQEIANSLKPDPRSRAHRSSRRRLPEFLFRPRPIFSRRMRGSRTRIRPARRERPQDRCRAHQHQPEQSRAHWPRSQRGPGRHLRAIATPCRTPRRSAELHRQHRRAGR